MGNKLKAMLCLAIMAMPYMMMAQKSELFDFGWQFTQNGKTTTVDLPHDWDIYSAPDASTGDKGTGTGGGWYLGGKGEYRKTFKTPDGEIVKMHFEGVYQKAEVYVNGHKAGQHAYGYTPFTVEITPYLKKVDKLTSKQVDKLIQSEKGKKEYLNEVIVKVDNSAQPNCRWYSGSGIYRHVWLQTMDSLHIAENGVFVTTPKVSASSASVHVEVMLENRHATAKHAVVSVEGQQQTVMIGAGESKKMVFDYTIDNPKLWSPETPHLYRAEVTLSESSASPKDKSRQTVTFGVRTFSFDAENGFVLNGKKVLINGACVHHDDGALGAMAFDAAEIRKVRQMKDAGFNLIRTSHNPSTRAFLDACDSIGMLVIDEAFDGWRSEKTKYDYSTLIDSCYKEDIAAMVMRDRNHPCVISWSIGNEVIERKDIRVVTTARNMKREVLRHDPTRPVTEALCAWDSDWEIYDPHFEVLDVAGYNYMIHKHKGDHQRDPKRVMWQTESFPRDAFGNWAVVNDHPYIVGDIVWTGLDYLGESGIGRYYYKGKEPEGEHYRQGGLPQWHGAYCGDVDITGWRKPISHYRDMLWNGSSFDTTSQPHNLLTSQPPTLYMAVKEPNGYHGEIRETQWSVWPMWESWNWQGWEGKPVEVEVYTKLPEVKLYLNDRLVGTKKVDRSTRFKAVFSVPYAPGTLRAEAGGKSVVLETAGEPARLRLTADRTVIAADGQDLAFITVEVVDKQGRVCPEAAIPCEASVGGRGSLLASASADLKDQEPYTSPKFTTWKGRAMIVVRGMQKQGGIKVAVKSSLPTREIRIKTKNN